jgi:hypothetical protein
MIGIILNEKASGLAARIKGAFLLTSPVYSFNKESKLGSEGPITFILYFCVLLAIDNCTSFISVSLYYAFGCDLS